MWFRNLTMFQFSSHAAPALVGLDRKLSEHALRKIGPLELSVSGFTSPLGDLSRPVEPGDFAHEVGGCTLLTFARDTKILPSQVINAELSERMRKLEKATGVAVGSRERRRIKDEIITDFLPRAFSRVTKTHVYIDPREGWLVIDTASRKNAEEVVSALREVLGSFPAVPVVAESSPRAIMTDWAARYRHPSDLLLGDEIELRDPAETGAIVRCRNQDIDTDEVREHLRSGKQVERMALIFRDRLSFVLSEDLSVRKLRFLDVVQDELGETDRESAAAELDATFALQVLELRELFAALDAIFVLPRPNGPANGPGSETSTEGAVMKN